MCHSHWFPGETARRFRENDVGIPELKPLPKFVDVFSVEWIQRRFGIHMEFHTPTSSMAISQCIVAHPQDTLGSES
jgi:hypothetical protein